MVANVSFRCSVLRGGISPFYGVITTMVALELSSPEKYAGIEASSSEVRNLSQSSNPFNCIGGHLQAAMRLTYRQGHGWRGQFQPELLKDIGNTHERSQYQLVCLGCLNIRGRG